MQAMVESRVVYRGPAKARKELADDYNVSVDTFNEWLRDLARTNELNIGLRRCLRPAEITVVINAFGDFRCD